MMKLPARRSMSLRRWLLAGVVVLPACTSVSVFAAPLQGEAYQRATAAYDAIARNDLATAEKEARAAVKAQADSADAARLLMDVLSRQGKPKEAIAAANEAVARGAADADLYAARGFLQQAAKNIPAAVSDFTKALSDPAYPAEKQRTVRLSLADAAAAQGKQQDVLDLLQPLMGEKSYDVKAREGFAAFGLNKFDQAAAAFAVAAAAARNDDERRTAEQGQAQAEAARAAAAKTTEAERAAAASAARTAKLAQADKAAARGKHQEVLDLLQPYLGEKSYDVKAREGFAAFGLSKFDQAAEAFSIAIAAARTDDERRTATQGKAQAVAQAKAQQAQAQPAPVLQPPTQPQVQPQAQVDTARTARLTAADKAAAQGQHQEVLDLLAPLAGEKSYDVKAREGFAAFALNKYDQAADAFAMALETARNADERHTAMKGQAQAEAGRGAVDRVRSLVQTLNTEVPGCDLDLAYTLLRVKDDAGALKIFEGACAQKMTAAAEMDAGYAAQRLVRNPDAIVHFSNALDKRRDSAKPFDADTEFGVRRTVDTLSREFGLNIGAFYRADRSAAGGGSVGQGIAEGYWQPPVIGNRDGRILQLYSRLSMNALAPGASTVQSSSTQAAFGVRYKPFADVNFVGAAERLVPIGSTAIADWLLRAGYSVGFNTDIQPSTHYNMSGNVYGEIDYLTNQGRTIGSLEAKYGVDRRLLESTPNLTASLYVNGAYNYDSAELKPSAAAIGPGVSFKYWFRESKNRAPASYVQMDVIYRFKVTPSDRASGLALQFSVSF